MFGLGMGELIIVGGIAVLFLGPKKIPELAKGLGQGIRDFKIGLKEVQETNKIEEKINCPHDFIIGLGNGVGKKELHRPTKRKMDERSKFLNES